VFITIDGKRDTTELAKMFPEETLAAALDMLSTEALIQPVIARAAPLPSPAPVNEESFRNARNLMVNTTLSFAGHVAGPLVRKLKNTSSLDELRAMREEWHKTVALNPMATMQLRTLEKHLDKLFA
jgi:hypothetical protein